MVKVTFEYDEEHEKWEPVVSGVKNETEARQAFNAVAITVHMEVNPILLSESKVKQRGNDFIIIPAV